MYRDSKVMPNLWLFFFYKKNKVAECFVVREEKLKSFLEKSKLRMLV